MERISQWVASQEIPSDLTIRAGDSVFPLHKAVVVPKCGYIRRAVAAASSKEDDPPAATVVELDLSAVPGGADVFEKAARYCYGANFEITARKGSGSSRAPKKATSFLGSVSRTLSRLNPFNGRWAKDTSSIADGKKTTTRDHVAVKPKRRRFSIG